MTTSLPRLSPNGSTRRSNDLAVGAAVVAFAALASGCALLVPPENSSPLLFGPEAAVQQGRRISYVQHSCPLPGTPGFILPPSGRRPDPARTRALEIRYSPGDRFNLLVFGSAEHSGDYVVSADGQVIIPFAGPIRAAGLSNTEFSNRLHKFLVTRGLFQAQALRLSVRPVQFAPINVTVAGAVFLPGRFTINSFRESNRPERNPAPKFGDSPVDRFVASALQAAGGIRPDADLTQIKLVRNGVSHNLDWHGAITGAPVDDVMLLEGDHLQVTEAGCFQSALVRPSQITPPGIRIFTSNLTQPAFSNSQSAVTKDSTAVPYGTRLLQGLVSANCVGGSLATNAARIAVLITRNPKTLQTEVVQRSIEELVRSPERDQINPYLMPDDAIACYDSAATDLREISTTINQLLLSVPILRGGN